MPITQKIHECECEDCQDKDKEHPNQALHHQINILASRLDEQQRRWFVALESKRIGHGGDVLMSKVTGLDEKTIRRGRQEMEAGLVDRPVGRVRLPGGGRPPIGKKIRPAIEGAIGELVHERTGGDPMSEKRWVRASLRQLSRELLGDAGSHAASARTVGRLLSKLDFRLRANVKSEEPGADHPDRDTQFGYIAKRKGEFIEAGDPVISVDTKKKDLSDRQLPSRTQAGRGEHRPSESTCMTFPVTLRGEQSPMGSTM